MRRATFAALALSTITTIPSLAEIVLVKPGDTLSGIAAQHKTTVSTIMHLNAIDHPDKLYAGKKIRVSALTDKKARPQSYFHKVVPGESVNKISAQYGVKAETIISLNNLPSADFLYVGQRLKLPTYSSQKSHFKKTTNHVVREGENLTTIANLYGTNAQKLLSLNEMKNGNKLYPQQSILVPQRAYSSRSKENEGNQTKTKHEMKRGETLSKLARKYDVSLKKLISLNKISDPSRIKEGSIIYINTPNPSTTIRKDNWLQYGPIQVNWANWKEMSGSHVALSKNKQDQRMFLAVNCPNKLLNTTDSKGNWRQWLSPMEKFEYKLINDLCKKNNI